tara:strand:- start:7186 stop:7401 length:216 start_codon:yes stop_codon:yes gene_type:complete
MHKPRVMLVVQPLKHSEHRHDSNGLVTARFGAGQTGVGEAVGPRDVGQGRAGDGALRGAEVRGVLVEGRME